MYNRTDWKVNDIITSLKMNNLEEGVSEALHESVKLFGAIGDGVTDDTKAIQSAIDNVHSQGGGTVYIPAGTFVITKHLKFYANMTLEGASQEATIIKQTGDEGHLSGTDASNSSIRNITFLGMGIDTGTGGVGFGRLNNDNTEALNIMNVTIKDCASGLSVSTPITSTFTNVRVQGIADSAFSFYGSGTSVVMSNCYALTCTKAGFNLDQLNYSVLLGCAAEVCGIGYNLTNNCNNVSLIGCGAEDQIPRGNDYPGVDFQVSGGVGNSLVSCYSRNNEHAGIILKGSGGTIIMGYREIGNTDIGLQGDENVTGLTLVGNNISGSVTLHPGTISMTGPTSSRPTNALYEGLSFYDTTLKKVTYYTGSGWVDAIGAAV